MLKSKLKTFQIRNKIIKYYNKVLKKKTVTEIQEISRNLGLNNNFLSCLESISCFDLVLIQDKIF